MDYSVPIGMSVSERKRKGGRREEGERQAITTTKKEGLKSQVFSSVAD